MLLLGGDGSGLGSPAAQGLELFAHGGRYGGGRLGVRIELGQGGVFAGVGHLQRLANGQCLAFDLHGARALWAAALGLLCALGLGLGFVGQARQHFVQVAVVLQRAGQVVGVGRVDHGPHGGRPLVHRDGPVASASGDGAALHVDHQLAQQACGLVHAQFAFGRPEQCQVAHQQVAEGVRMGHQLAQQLARIVVGHQHVQAELRAAGGASGQHGEPFWKRDATGRDGKRPTLASQGLASGVTAQRALWRLPSATSIQP